ncbi:hypothetical protein Hamer_G013066 [Homarus americanus]|uniref:Uncharacterized protein n=1 Tax=Homarus americanus TaxID=6706 RepID=A0A8J5MXI6_HOMAM|nr:hypothetical protein Hamer_G013066 [Homarus americanus]
MECGIRNAMDGTEDNLLYETDSSDYDISSRDDSELGDESNCDDFSGFEDELNAFDCFTGHDV